MSEQQSSSDLEVSLDEQETTQVKITPAAEDAPVSEEAVVPEVVDPETPTKLKVEEPKAPSELLDDDTLTKLRDEVLDNEGQFTEEHYELLEKRGIPRSFADSYLEGEKAKAQAIVGKVASECGGLPAMQEALDWAAKNLSPGAVAQINQQLASSDPDVVITAMRGIQSRAGIDDTPLHSGSTGTNQSAVFRDESEFRAARRDPRFESSTAYRAEFMRRAHASKQAGTIKF